MDLSPLQASICLASQEILPFIERLRFITAFGPYSEADESSQLFHIPFIYDAF
jgi:hypothetical protein